MRAVVAFLPNCNQDAGWLARFEHRHHLVGFGVPEVWLHEFVAPALVVLAFGRIQSRSTPFFTAVLQPISELIGDLG
jgi:hypothetical protein